MNRRDSESSRPSRGANGRDAEGPYPDAHAYPVDPGYHGFGGEPRPSDAPVSPARDVPPTPDAPGDPMSRPWPQSGEATPGVGRPWPGTPTRPRRFRSAPPETLFPPNGSSAPPSPPDDGHQPRYPDSEFDVFAVRKPSASGNGAAPGVGDPRSGVGAPRPHPGSYGPPPPAQGQPGPQGQPGGQGQPAPGARPWQAPGPQWPDRGPRRGPGRPGPAAGPGPFASGQAGPFASGQAGPGAGPYGPGYAPGPGPAAPGQPGPPPRHPSHPGPVQPPPGQQPPYGTPAGARPGQRPPGPGQYGPGAPGARPYGRPYGPGSGPAGAGGTGQPWPPRPGQAEPGPARPGAYPGQGQPGPGPYGPGQFPRNPHGPGPGSAPGQAPPQPGGPNSGPVGGPASGPNSGPVGAPGAGPGPRAGFEYAGGPVIGQRDRALPEAPAAAGTGPVAALETDNVAAFARDLRVMRNKACLDYPEMAEKSHYTMRTLASAAGGLRMPTLPVLMAFVTACGGDQAEWEERWGKIMKTAGGQTQLPASDTDATEAADDGPEPEQVYVITSAPARDKR